MYKLNFFSLVFLLVGICTISGCGGGGGGGGGIVTPNSDFEGITGALDFSSLALPDGFYSLAWPASEASTSLSIANFSKSSSAALLLVNYNAVSKDIVLSAGQQDISSKPSIRGDIKIDQIAYSRTGVSKFYTKLRELEERYAALPASSIRGSVKPTIRVQQSPETSKVFKLYKDEGKYASVTANLYDSSALPLNGSSGYIYFYVDKDVVLGGNVKSYIDDIISGWQDIYTTIHEKFGNELMAGDAFTGLELGNDIYVLITPKISDMDSQLAGFFYSGDLYPSAKVAGGISNECKIFYLNLQIEGRNAFSTSIMKSTMAHEFQHMIFFSNRLKNGMPADDAWLNETLSAYAESACGYSVYNKKNQSKAILMQEYFDRMATTPLVQNKNWGSEAQYGQVALFGEWLAEKYSDNGNFTALVSSKKRSIEAIEDFTKKTFETIYAEWMTAMYLDQDSGVYGYKNLDWKSYDFEGGSSVTLSGPVSKDSRINGGLLTSKRITLAPTACYVIEFCGGNGNPLDIQRQLNSGVTVFELHSAK